MNKEPNVLPCFHAAVGIVIDKSNRILISKRPAHKIKGGFWEFPGGKVESDETPKEALVRELKEEVGLTVLQAEPFMQLYHEYSEHSVRLDVFVITDFLGEPQSIEGQEIQWITREQFPQFQFLEANERMIQKLVSHYQWP